MALEGEVSSTGPPGRSPGPWPGDEVLLMSSHLPSVHVFLCTQISLFIRMLVILDWGNLITSFQLDRSPRLYFQIRSHSHVLEVENSTSWGLPWWSSG